MKYKEKLYWLTLASISLVLFLIFISSTVSAAAQSASPAGTYAYVTNFGSGTVSVIDIATNNVTATVPVGDGPFGVAVTPDGSKVYVANWYSGTVSVIDTSTNDVTATINIESSPWDVEVSPDGTKVYVTEGDRVSVIDTTTNNVTAVITLTIRGTADSQGIAVSPDGTQVYVTDSDPDERSTVSVIDTATNTVKTTIYFDPLGIGYSDVTIAPDGTKLYVTIGDSAYVHIIDTATNDIVARVRVGNSPYRVAVTQDGTKVYVTNLEGTVSVINTATNAVTATVNVGIGPQGVAVSPDGTKVYVTNPKSNTVSVIDTTTNTVIATVNVGGSPTETVIDGSLACVEGSSDVYLIENGMKRHFTSSEALEWNGYSFDNVTYITSEKLQSYPEGEDISISQPIIDKYHELGSAPIFGASLGEGEKTGEKDSAGTYCSYINFENGSIECFQNGDLKGQAYAIFNPFYTKWASMGYAKSVLGYPIDNMSNEETSKFGTKFRYQNFANGTEKGALEYNISSGNVYEIHGTIFAKWGALGYAQSDLGLPIMDQENRSGHWYCDFEGGNISWNNSIGNYIVKLNDVVSYPEPVTNTPPTVTSVTITSPEDSVHDISWTFYDAEGDHEKEFKVEIWTETGGTGTKIWDLHYYNQDISSDEITKVFYANGYGKEYLRAGQKYYVRVQIFDGNSLSEWKEINFVSLYHESPTWEYDDFNFVQITDMHIGSRDDGWNNENLKNVIYEINNLPTELTYGVPTRPKIMLVTGDLVIYDDENSNSEYEEYLYGNFERFKDIMSGTNIYKVYVPGNHDRRIDPTGLLPQNLNGYDRTIRSLSQSNPTWVNFDIEGIKFIGLDSEGDYNTTIGADAKISYFYHNGLWLPYIDPNFYDNTPESWGLSEIQINYLKGLDKDQPKVIFMHHPAIQPTGVNDQPVPNSIDKEVEPNNYGGNDGCIRWQRAEFIDYCKDPNNNVQQVVTGHSHKDVVVDANGDRTEGTGTQYPLFLQTDSTTHDFGHYRMFFVRDGQITSRSYLADYHEHIYAELDCPANLHVYDSQKRYTGLNALGEVELGIPNSFYEGRCNDSEPIIISLYDVDDEYQLKVVANLTDKQKNSPEIETFNLTIKQYVNETTNTTVTYHNVPLTENTIATLATNLTTTTYILEIDSNGDGVKDDTREPDSINIDGVETIIVNDVSPASIANLQSTNGTTWINWTWQNPTDPDFNHTEIYLNNIFQTNTSAEYFNATGLEPETDYTIGTRTVGISGNVNETWVNSTATTLKAPIIVEAGSDQIVEEGASVNFEGSFTAFESHTYSYHWDFGDDSAEDSSPSTSHTYADDGVYTVNLTVTDEEGNFGNDTLLVTVNNAIPVVESGSDIVVTAGNPVSFTGNFSDLGWLDTHTAEWNFGEGTEAGSVSEENEYPDSTGTVSGNFSYFDAGKYTVTLNVADDDGGIGQDQLTVTVRPIEAEVTFDPETFNLNSTGEWVTAYIELPAGYSVSGIDIGSVLLNGTVHAVSDSKYDFVTNESEYLTDLDLDGISERMFKFNHAEVAGILKAGDQVTVTFTGKVEYNNGVSSGMASFEGSDVIRVTQKDSKQDKKK